MPTLDEIVATLRAAGVVSITLDLVTRPERAGEPKVAPTAAMPEPVRALTPEEQAERAAQAEADRRVQDEADHYAATPVAPVDVEALMRDCDEQLDCWRSEQAIEASQARSAIVLVPDGQAVPR